MIKVLYEDNHLLVVEKPVNILSQGDNTSDDDMVNLLKKYLKEKYNKPGNVFVGLVHRLDRPVGGCMVFAKTSKAASRLSEQVRNKSFKKTYRAVIHGKMNKQEDNLMDYLYKNKKDRRKNMIIADIAVAPLRPYKGEEEMYKVVDACIEIIQNSGLNYEIGAMSTTVEGEFDEVFEIIKKAHKLPFELGCERVITTVRIDEKFGGLTINEKLKNHRQV